MTWDCVTATTHLMSPLPVPSRPPSSRSDWVEWSQKRADSRGFSFVFFLFFFILEQVDCALKCFWRGVFRIVIIWILYFEKIQSQTWSFPRLQKNNYIYLWIWMINYPVRRMLSLLRINWIPLDFDWNRSKNINFSFSKYQLLKWP